MIFYAAMQQTYPGFKDWILLALGLTAALTVIMTYPVGHAPAWPLVVIVNVVLVFSADRLHRGMARFSHGICPECLPRQFPAELLGDQEDQAR